VTVDDEHTQLLKALTVERYRRPAPRKAVTVRPSVPASPAAIADLVNAVSPDAHAPVPADPKDLQALVDEVQPRHLRSA
jgi:hypothetical protein